MKLTANRAQTTLRYDSGEPAGGFELHAPATELATGFGLILRGLYAVLSCVLLEKHRQRGLGRCSEHIAAGN